MFETISRLAEKVAGNVGESRRGFLGQLGRGALAVAGAFALLPRAAGQTTGGVVYCTYHCTNSSYGYKPRGNLHYTQIACYPAGTTCPNLSTLGCRLQKQSTASTCASC